MNSDRVFSCDKEVLGGIPVFVGTRVPVETLIDHLAAGDTLGKFLEDFPSVSQEKAKGFLELMGQRAIDEAGQFI